MKRLIIMSNLFTIPQHAFLEENHEIIENFYFNKEDLTKTIFSIDNLDEIIFYGNKQYLQPFIDKIKTEEIKRYNKNKIIIKVKEDE